MGGPVYLGRPLGGRSVRNAYAEARKLGYEIVLH